LLILLAIPHAEAMQDRRQTLVNYIFEHIVKAKEMLRKEGIPSSYSAWQVPVPRINEILNKDKKLQAELKAEMEEKLTEEERQEEGAVKSFYYKHRFRCDTTAINEAIRVILHISISRSPRIIFATYNRGNWFTAKTAAFQIFLNMLRVYADLTIQSIREKKRWAPKTEKALAKALSQPKNQAEDKGEFARLMSEHKKQDLIRSASGKKRTNRTLAIFHGFEEADDRFADHLQLIFEGWPHLTVDGAVGPGLKKAIKFAINFFKEEVHFDEKLIGQEEHLDELMSTFWIEGAESSAIFFGDSVGKKDEIIHEIMQHEAGLEQGIIEVMKREYGHFLKSGYWQKFMKDNDYDEDGFFVHVFRRLFSGNPGDPYHYVEDAMKAYVHVREKMLGKHGTEYLIEDPEYN